MYRPSAEKDIAARRKQFERVFKATPANSALNLLERSVAMAVDYNHNHIANEHLLLGALLIPQTKEPFEYLGVTFTKAVYVVDHNIDRGRGPVDRTRLELSPKAEEVMKSSVEEAARLGDPLVEARHIVLGMTNQFEGVAASTLERFMVTAEKLKATIERFKYGGTYSNVEAVRTLLMDPNTSLEERVKIDAALRSLLQDSASQKA